MSPDPRIGAQLDLLRGGSPEPVKAKVPAYQKESETSKAAALRIIPKAEGMRYEVLSVIADAGDAGCTRKEIEAATGMLTQTVTPRLVELEQAGDIAKWTYFDAEAREIRTMKRENCAVYRVARKSA